MGPKLIYTRVCSMFIGLNSFLFQKILGFKIFVHSRKIGNLSAKQDENLRDDSAVCGIAAYSIFVVNSFQICYHYVDQLIKIVFMFPSPILSSLIVIKNFRPCVSWNDKIFSAFRICSIPWKWRPLKTTAGVFKLAHIPKLLTRKIYQVGAIGFLKKNHNSGFGFLI